MKKIIIAAIVFATAGLLPSCTKETKFNQTAAYEHSTVFNKKDLGTAD